MSLTAVENICKQRKCGIPKNIEIKEAYWYTDKGAKAGGRAIVAKYGKVGGNEEYRKKKWREWWKNEGKWNPSKITRPLPFRKPEFSEALAEFVGIVLGDGGISNYQITVTLNSIDDGEYLKFVQKLVENLFEIPTGTYFHNGSIACRIVISRTGLISYLTQKIGLKRGNKVRQQVDIPRWIKKDKKYSIACVRGLIDTDGCVIIHRYFSKRKRYLYKKVGFKNHSCPLLKSVSNMLSDLKIEHRIMKSGRDVRIEAKKDVERYFRLVGTNNPKHLKRYKIA